MDERDLALAEAVRAALLQTAAEAYEDAGLRGLCADGRWECALDAIRALPLATILHAAAPRLAGAGRSSDSGKGPFGDEPFDRKPGDRRPGGGESQ